MNRHQQRAVLLFGLLLMSAALLGHASSSEAQALHAARSETRDVDGGLVLTLGDVVFDAGKASLKPSATTAIDRLAQLLGVYPERSVRIEGHTDSLGDAAANQQLSERRAAAVRDALLARGIAAARVEAVGYGATRPIADNRSESGRQKNRRIEIVLSDEHGAADAGWLSTRNETFFPRDRSAPNGSSPLEPQWPVLRNSRSNGALGSFTETSDKE